MEAIGKIIGGMLGFVASLLMLQAIFYGIISLIGLCMYLFL